MIRKLNRIKTALVDQGKTNKWLAEQLGKDPATISKWCTNASQPSLEMMMVIAKVLNVEMNDLVRLDEAPDPKSKDIAFDDTQNK
ncbi:helix-turn-helix transcriptional regulator [Segatella bryantii]|jgi:transcriptional regulator with XRE-family HTH domain|uniref:helix-turn-helix transcriptional regulator n=1 Tax=Segatella bryantii TaxID=77095 RepID=UPI000889C44F|nr:helix-turn-helix transcriptional regulator [Segatella bryantii]MDR4930115.1 helix-turn-helix transcriptional regulator [Segatella bryantii]UKK75373.1 helix-turn-helix domain-containing protein [Segatella bryantii]SDL76723.1 Helix-turn-helix [Segatella bryantii]